MNSKCEALLPCPFCGNRVEPKLWDGDAEFQPEYWTVACDARDDHQGCGATSGYQLTKAKAIYAWNRRTPVVPDETGLGRARTVDHAEEPELDLSAIVTDEAIWEGLEASVDGGANVGAWLPSTLASTIMRAALEAAAPLLLAELRRLRNVRAPSKESHKGGQA